MIKPDNSLHIYLRTPFEFHVKAQGHLLLQGVFVPLGQDLVVICDVVYASTVCVQKCSCEDRQICSMSILVFLSKKGLGYIFPQPQSVFKLRNNCEFWLLNSVNNISIKNMLRTCDLKWLTSEEPVETLNPGYRHLFLVWKSSINSVLFLCCFMRQSMIFQSYMRQNIDMEAAKGLTSCLFLDIDR